MSMSACINDKQKLIMQVFAKKKWTHRHNLPGITRMIFAAPGVPKGKPAVTMLLGFIEDTGVAQRSPAVAAYLEKAGLRGMKSRDVISILLSASTGARPVLGYFDVDWDRWAELRSDK